VHFPDSDPQWKGVSSSQLLSQVMALAHERGRHIVNVDATIMIEQPKMRAYILSMRENIAAILGVEVSCVSVKAKTGEGLDAVGQGLAVAAQAIVLVES
jgi:2-C-methyl-D-erythritol 2,4-cyclodiphosphate synthase